MDPPWIHIGSTFVPKKQATVYIPIEIWAQVEDLKGYFGDSPSEVVTYGLRTWFATSEREIRFQLNGTQRAM